MKVANLREYYLFISHAWRYDDDYYRLVNLLDAAPLFRWKNYSVPRHDPAIDPNRPAGRRSLEEALDDQMRPVQCVLVISGMYASYSRWIQYEMDRAVQWGKPIIGLRPRGQERVPVAVQNVATEMVGWTTDSIVSAIRRHALKAE